MEYEYLPTDQRRSQITARLQNLENEHLRQSLVLADKRMTKRMSGNEEDVDPDLERAEKALKVIEEEIKETKKLLGGND